MLSRNQLHSYDSARENSWSMIISHLCVVLAVLLTDVKSAERGSSCVTPNQESVTCISINDCLVIKDAITTPNKTAIEFAKKSQCGYDTEPLVCCGSVGYPISTATMQTNYEPTTQRPVRKKKVNLNIISSTTLPDRTICGVERETPRLIGGTATEIDEFPWMALIGYKNKTGSHAGYKCGGTLINNRYVLTAAHCILTDEQGFFPEDVRLGEWRLSTDNDCISSVAVEDCADPVINVKIEQTIVHPYFSPRNGNNDIALLRLQKDVKYSDFVRPICVPPANIPPPPVGTIMTVCGWGATENGSQSDIKQKIQIPLVANSECSKQTTSATTISPNQVCAGGVQGKDACQGDSGGPLMRTYQDDTSQWYQEGVVSRGRGCGRRGYAGIYTRVSRYVNWITLSITGKASED